MEKNLIYSKKLACIVKLKRLNLLTETEFLLIKNKLSEEARVNNSKKSA